MKRRSFLKKSALATGTAFTTGSISATPASQSLKEFYELRVYQFSGGAGVNQLKSYYTNAVIPLLNRQGAKVGAFAEYGMEDPPRIYIFHAYKSPADYWDTIQAMKTDKQYLTAAQSYFNLPADKPVFERYETFLMEAFDGIPQFKMPDKNRGLFELRTYESYNEDAFRRKIKMFDVEELPLFEKVGLHPVFFGEMIAGRFMPALTYMLWFKNMEERNQNWDKFRSSEEWQTMRVKEEYADTVSKVKKIFLTPLDFSQV
ncbi:NIPSNAP protein [Mariniphaga anaerophila]|uniref:NIPSNAP protein n=1 Tax=Mariniphaga anaerophila TaxID=1484053 RepID=A0A1M4TJ35_9BACT|nr:NIPSNAP family protein [Mariniphaga anaerophila]SHE44491.1 NIPSNAP protein [Mariniphaga anaerophila]